MPVPLKLYIDQHVPRAITLGLRLRHIDVITAYEDQAHEMADPDLLDRATSLGRVLFTQDDDLLVEATRRQRVGIAFR
jgi:predicted nuclease of predicted toxin-antitoxin system